MITKRIFDLFLTIPTIITLSPLFALIAIWIKLDSKGPVFFLQERVGLNEKIFKIIKFRTMQVNTEHKGQLTIGNDNRITKSGKFLRKHKIDELPQLINVLKGEMSLVGPRPEVPRYVACYPEKARQIILSVPPGITDNASVSYINENDILARSSEPEKVYVKKILPDKLKFYKEYVTHRSTWLDLKIILRTLKLIIF